MTYQPSAACSLRAALQGWFDNPANIDMTSIYLERTLNFRSDAG